MGTTLAFSVGGGRSDSNTFVLDGGINNDLLSNAVVYNPNPDSIQEFKVLTSDFTAEYGRSAGGIITNWQGGSCAEGGQVLAAGDRRIHEIVVKLLNE